MGEGIARESGMDMDTLPYLKWETISNFIFRKFCLCDSFHLSLTLSLKKKKSKFAHHK